MPAPNSSAFAHSWAFASAHHCRQRVRARPRLLHNGGVLPRLDPPSRARLDSARPLRLFGAARTRASVGAGTFRARDGLVLQHGRRIGRGDGCNPPHAKRPAVDCWAIWLSPFGRPSEVLPPRSEGQPPPKGKKHPRGPGGGGRRLWDAQLAGAIKLEGDLAAGREVGACLLLLAIENFSYTGKRTVRRREHRVSKSVGRVGIWGDGFVDEGFNPFGSNCSWDDVADDELTLFLPSLKTNFPECAVVRARRLRSVFREALSARVRWAARQAVLARQSDSIEDALGRIRAAGVILSMPIEEAYHLSESSYAAWFPHQQRTGLAWRIMARSVPEPSRSSTPLAADVLALAYLDKAIRVQDAYLEDSSPRTGANDRRRFERFTLSTLR